MLLPTDKEDVDVENKLLDQHDTETSSRRLSDSSEEKETPTWNSHKVSKSWLVLTTFNMILVSISIILNRNASSNFTRSCIRETSAYCKNSLYAFQLG